MKITQNHTRRSTPCPTSNVGPLNPLPPTQVCQLEHEQHNMLLNIGTHHNRCVSSYDTMIRNEPLTQPQKLAHDLRSV